MLVLSRGPRQKLFFTVPPSSQGTTIELEVIEFRHGQVRLGLTAPNRVAIERQEIRKDNDEQR